MSRLLIAALLATSCARVDLDVEGRACDDRGECLPGYVCLDGLCVEEAGGDAGGDSAPPADEGDPTCILGLPESCATCNDDCTARVQNAAAVCDASRQCGYAQCHAYAVDVDNDARNGCECTVGTETCNGADDDCDGAADDGFACALGRGQACNVPALGPGDNGERACLAGCAGFATECRPAWWNAAWAKRRDIVMTPAALPLLTDVPVLVVLEAASFDYATARQGGADLRFIWPYDGSLLAHEIERWDPDGASYVWVRLPSLTVQTLVHLYYGNPSPTALPAGHAARVWSNGYAGVWHLASPGAEGFLDSSAGARHGVDLQQDSADAELIGPAQRFNEGDEVRVDLAGIGALGTTTLEAFFAPAGEAFRYRRRVELERPTIFAGQQVLTRIVSETPFYERGNYGASVRVLGDGGLFEPFDRRNWSGSLMDMWTRLREVGATGFTLIYGNPTVTVTDETGVFDFADELEGTTLDTSVWRTTGSISMGGSSMTVATGSVQLVNPLPFDVASGYMVEVAVDPQNGVSNEGTAIPYVGSAPFVAANNPSAEAVLVARPRANSNDVSLSIADGGGAGYDVPSFDIGAPPNQLFPAGFGVYDGYVTYQQDFLTVPAWSPSATRYSFAKQLRYITLGGSTDGSDNVRDTTYHWVHVRRWDGAELTTTVAEEQVGGVSTGAFAIGAQPNLVLASFGGTLMSTYMAGAGPYYVAMRRDGTSLSLFVDGQERMSAVAPTAAPVPVARLQIGQPHALDGVLDEVRLSSVPRPREWIDVQQLSMRQQLLTVGPAQPRDP